VLFDRTRAINGVSDKIYGNPNIRAEPRDQYTSIAFGKRGREMGVNPSVGSVGEAFDNAMAESVFASLECELIDRGSFKTKGEARMGLFTWIEAWYNPRRRHSALGRISPIDVERRHNASLTNQTASLRTGLPTAGVCVAVATPAADNPALPHC
jgi:putative transposase